MSLAGKTINQHYVPKFYLDMFDTENDLTVFDKLNQKHFRGHPAQIAKERYFYDVASTLIADSPNFQIVERTLGKIETEGADRLREIVASDVINFDKKIFLAQWIALQHMRTRAFRNTIGEMLKKTLPLKAAAVLKERGNEEITHEDIEVKVVNEALMHLQVLINPENLTTFIRGILECEWLYFSNTTENLYFTSDTPVALFQRYPGKAPGLLVVGTQIIFPLSPHRCLWLRRKEKHQKEQIRLLESDGKLVTKFNRRQVEHCERFFYYAASMQKFLDDLKSQKPAVMEYRRREAESLDFGDGYVRIRPSKRFVE
jgi:hypothetical protein